MEPKRSRGRQLTTMMAVTLLREPTWMGVSENVRPSCQENSGRRTTRVSVCSVDRHKPRVRVLLKSTPPPALSSSFTSSSLYTCAVVFWSLPMDKRIDSSVTTCNGGILSGIVKSNSFIMNCFISSYNIHASSLSTTTDPEHSKHKYLPPLMLAPAFPGPCSSSGSLTNPPDSRLHRSLSIF